MDFSYLTQNNFSLVLRRLQKTCQSSDFSIIWQSTIVNPTTWCKKKIETSDSEKFDRIVNVRKLLLKKEFNENQLKNSERKWKTLDFAFKFFSKYCYDWDPLQTAETTQFDQIHSF